MELVLILIFAIVLLARRVLKLEAMDRVHEQEKTAMAKRIVKLEMECMNLRGIAGALRQAENWRRWKEQEQARVEHNALLDEIEDLTGGAQ